MSKGVNGPLSNANCGGALVIKFPFEIKLSGNTNFRIKYYLEGKKAIFNPKTEMSIEECDLVKDLFSDIAKVSETKPSKHCPLLLSSDSLRLYPGKGVTESQARLIVQDYVNAFLVNIMKANNISVENVS